MYDKSITVESDGYYLVIRDGCYTDTWGPFDRLENAQAYRDNFPPDYTDVAAELWPYSSTSRPSAILQPTEIDHEFDTEVGCAK